MPSMYIPLLSLSRSRILNQSSIQFQKFLLFLFPLLLHSLSDLIFRRTMILFYSKSVACFPFPFQFNPDGVHSPFLSIILSSYCTLSMRIGRIGRKETGEHHTNSLNSLISIHSFIHYLPQQQPLHLLLFNSFHFSDLLPVPVNTKKNLFHLLLSS